jgi:divalent metal cation (Fe/Co/Zn/Cd) transporter
MPKIGFSITLLSLSLSTTGFNKITDYVLAGIIALSGIFLLFENISSNTKWKSIVRWADDLDITYVAFGLGLILVSSKFSSNAWSFLLLAGSGVIFAGAGISKLIGTGFSDVIKKNAIIGIIIGFFVFIAGVVMLIMTWNSIIEEPLTNAYSPIIIICLGIEFIYFAFRKWYKSRKA